VLLLAKENYDAFKKSDIFQRSIGVKIWDHKTFSQAKDIYIVYDKPGGTIQQIVFLAWHPEVAIHSQGSLTKESMLLPIKHQDKIWNTAAAISGHQMKINKSYFLWRAQQKTKFDLMATQIPNEIPGENALSRVLRLLVFERSTNNIVPWNQIGPTLQKWVERNEFTVNSESALSAVEQIQRAQNSKAMKTQAEQGWSGLRRGTETQRRDGFQTLVRGRATRLGNQQLEVDKYGTFTGAGDAAATRVKKEGYEKRKLKISEETRVLIDALWKFSTMSQPGDPHMVQRKCGRCGTSVVDDVGLTYGFKLMAVVTNCVGFTSQRQFYQDPFGVRTFARVAYRHSIRRLSRCRL